MHLLPSVRKFHNSKLFFSKIELSKILSCYSLGVSKGNWKDNNPDGLWEEYHKNGQLSYKYNYKDGKKDGVWVNFNQDGSLKKTETWKDGEKID